MRHLYNEDFSDFENAVVTIKQQEDNTKSNQGEKDKNSEMKSLNERLNDQKAEANEDQTKSPEDLIQSFSTLSGIALPMESRFV